MEEERRPIKMLGNRKAALCLGLRNVSDGQKGEDEKGDAQNPQ
ncbi:MAG: hypothetical protein AAGF13_06680 [Pseudomonadota bacterium]